MTRSRVFAAKIGVFSLSAAVVLLAAGAACRKSSPPDSREAEPAAQGSVESVQAGTATYAVATQAATTQPIIMRSDVAVGSPVSTQPETDFDAEAAGPPARVMPAGQRSPVVKPLREPEPLESLKRKPLYKFNEREVDIYLRYLSKAEPNPVNRLLHLARKDIGQPYELYLLGEFPYETYDPDPMYCLSRTDCVTFCEQVYAMALSRDWGSFFQTLQRLRYKGGQVSILTRNHETICDWYRNNGWLFTDLTRGLVTGGGRRHR